MDQNVNLVFIDKCLYEEENEDDTQKLIDMYSDFITYDEDIDQSNNVIHGFNDMYYGGPHEFDESFSLLVDYNENNTVKQLQKICDYYSIKLNKSKMKKADIINLILVFENESSNKMKVIQRKKLWFYISELEKDKYMKQYLLW